MEVSELFNVVGRGAVGGVAGGIAGMLIYLGYFFTSKEDLANYKTYVAQTYATQQLMERRLDNIQADIREILKQIKE